MYSAAKSHVVSVLGPPPTRYAVHMTLELNRTASTAEQLNSLLTQIMENFSVSDHEGPLTDEVEAFLNEQEHLTVRRHGDTVVASTDFGKPSRVILAGHLDTVPVIDNFPPKWLEPGDSLIREEIAHAHPEDRVLWGRGATDMKASDAVMLYLAATLDGRTPETTPNKTAMDYEANGGRLMQVEGKVTDVTPTNRGKGVSRITLKDGNGDFAEILIEKGIVSGADGKNDLASQVKEGRTVRAIGILHLDSDGTPVLRVRNCDEVVYVPPVPVSLGSRRNPRTGDLIWIAVGVMVLSGIALAVLLRKKKR